MVAKLFNGEVTTDIVLNTPLTGQYAPPPERIIEEVEEQADDIKQQGESDDEKSPIKPARPDATRPDTDGGADSPDSEDGSETSDSPEYRPGDNTLPDPADSPETPDSPGTQVIITPADDYDDLKQGDGPFVSP